MILSRNNSWSKSSLLLAFSAARLLGQQGGPSIQILDPAPSNGAIFTDQAALSLHGSATGVAGITEIRWQSIGRFGDLASIARRPDAGTIIDWSTASIGLRPGANYIQLEAIDRSNRHAEAVVTIYYLPKTPTAIGPVDIRSSYYKGRPVTYVVRGGLAIYEGDIILGTAGELEQARVQGHNGGTAQAREKPRPEGSSIAFSTEYWPKTGGVAQVPYTISTRDQAVQAIVTSINTAVTSFNSTFSGVIQWVPQTTQTAYVIFDFDPSQQNGVCEVTNVGMAPANQQPQTVGGAGNCTAATVLHEMGHIIGAWHEQSRVDRNNYVSVVTNDIDKPQLSNFNQLAVDEVDMGLFDYASVMEYFAQAFSKEGLSTTIESVPVAGIPLSNTTGYTTGDIDSFMRLYGHAPTQITIDSNPSGAQVMVDGTTYTAPHMFTWALNSNHTLNVSTTTTQTIGGKAYMFGRWNIPGATTASQNITINPGSGTPYSPAASPAITVYAANFVLLHPYASSVYPSSADGTVVPTPAASINFAGTSYYYDRQAVSIQANPATNFSFYEWFNTSLYNLYANPYNYPVLTDMPNMTGAFTGNPVTTITGSAPLLNPPPFGLFPNFAVTIDGASAQTPINYATDISGDSGWTAGSSHTINATPSPQSPVTTNISYAWSSWSDGLGQSHSITQGASGTHRTITANYTPTWRAIVNPSPYCGGTISPVLSGSNSSDQQLLDGTIESYTPNPATGFVFQGWGGDLSGSSNPDSVTIHDELLGTAFFNLTGTTAPFTVTNINPASLAASNLGATVTITGTGFLPSAFYTYWDYNYRSSTATSSTSATVTLNAGDLDTPGFHRLSVENYSSVCNAYVDSTFAITANASGPNLSISKSHAGNFMTGQQNATYTVLVANAGGAGTTSGTITVTETVPSGLTLVSMAGTGWTCPGGGTTCTRSDALAGGSSYPALTVTVNVASNATSPQVNQVSASGGESATIVATDSTMINSPPTVVSVTPINGGGSPQTFNATFASNLGAADLNSVYLVINSSLSAASACYFYYVRASNSLYLVNDAGSGTVAGTITPGTAGTLSNSQCTIANAGATTISGNNLTLPVNITFAGGFTGAKNVYALAYDNQNLNSGWQLEGTWTVVTNPTVVSVTPINGGGSPQTFNATFASNAGAADLNSVYLVFNSSLSASSACYLYYLRASNALYLVNDAGSGAVAGTITPGTAGMLSNSQCTIANAGAATLSGNNLTLPVNITFAGGFTGTKNVYALAYDNENLNSGWQSEGTWTLGVTNPTVVSVTPINGGGSPETFNATFASNLGAADLNSVYLVFNSSLSAASACYFYYLRASNTLYLVNDAGSGTVAGTITPGTAGTLSNSQCTIANAGAATLSGNNLTLPVKITFAGGFTGTKNVYALAYDNENLNSGWQSEGAWTPAATNPTVVSVTPINGAGSPQTFNATFASNLGAADLNSVYLVFNSSLNAASACYLYYVSASNALYLVNDAGSGTVAGTITPGTAGMLSNSQCTIANAGAATLSGNNLKLPVNITFAGGFTGAKNVYGLAYDNENLNSGWQLMGTWTGH